MRHSAVWLASLERIPLLPAAMASLLQAHSAAWQWLGKEALGPPQSTWFCLLDYLEFLCSGFPLGCLHMEHKYVQFVPSQRGRATPLSEIYLSPVFQSYSFQGLHHPAKSSATACESMQICTLAISRPRQSRQLHIWLEYLPTGRIFLPPCLHSHP